MKTNTFFQSGIFGTRSLVALTFCLTGALLATLSFAGSNANRARKRVASPEMATTTAFGGADPTTPGVPRYQNFDAPDGTSAQPGSGEFNIGFSPLTKHVFVMNTGPIWRLTTPENFMPAKPECCEALWEDKSAQTTNTGLDPILWTDQKTGRTFASNSTAGANFVYAYTDAAAPFNDGDVWNQVAASPPDGGVDHETLGSGPFPASLSGLTTPANQGEYVLYCSQDDVGSNCQVSVDLGASYGGGVIATGPGAMNSQGCGGLHGHVHVAPDGTAWLPDNSCGSHQGGAFTLDAGTTPWTEFSVQKPVGDADGPAFTTTPQSDGADPSIGIDRDNTVYYCYVNQDNATEGHVHVAVGKRVGSTVNWIRDADVGASHGIVNAAEVEAVGGSAGRAACGFIGTNTPDSPGNYTYENGNFPGVWYAYIATTYDEGRTWVTVNATPNDPVQNHTGVWQQGGSGENGDRNLLDFNEITIDDHGRVLYGYSDGCHTDTCIHGNNLGSGQAPNVDRGPYLERGAFMRVARQIGGKPLIADFDPIPAEPSVPKPPCLSAKRDCSAAHLTWKAPDNGGADITGYSILRGTSAGGETVLVANTGNLNTTFDDPVDSSVRHYFYVVKAINAEGGGVSSNEIDLSSELLANDDNVTTQKNLPVKIGVLDNDCGLPALTVTSVSTPTNGTATINGGTRIVYTPANNFFGVDSFTYTVRNGSGSTATATVRVTVNPSCLLANTGNYLDDFESGAPGWTVEKPRDNNPGSQEWMVVPDASAHSSTHSFKGDSAVLDLKDDRLISPVQKLSSTSHLKFWHRYQFEDGFDGGAVEVSTDGGTTWVDVLAGGGNFVTGGYNGHISPSYASPIAGRPAWTGGDATAAMSLVDIDLGAFAGLNVRVRFRLACDMFLAGSEPGVGWWIDDVQFTNTLAEAAACPTVVSQKTHGNAGTFNIDLTNGNGIECRTGGTNGTHKLVFTFPQPLTDVSGASVTGGIGTVMSNSIGSDPHQYIVNLTGVANEQRLNVTLSGVIDAAGHTAPGFSATMGVLAGDTNSDGFTDAVDVGPTKSQSGKAVTDSPVPNFREDVNIDGFIDAVDTALVKSKSGTKLP